MCFVLIFTDCIDRLLFLLSCSITEAVNETKDKVKYMDSLKRPIEMLYHGATPQTIMQTALPGLVNNVKQMDSISRYYSRSGFLGIFFTKVSFPV